MSSKESLIKRSPETHITSPANGALSPTHTAATPSMAPTTLATEEGERLLGATLPPVTIESPNAMATTAQASVTTGGAHRHPLSPLERVYDPARDDLPINELLTRPRLSRLLNESYKKSAMNGRTMKPLRASVAGLNRVVSKGGSCRGGEFEMEKERMRALGVEMGKLKLASERVGSAGSAL
jgi:hypothetical protein